jgi:hypothetical protein
MPTGFRALFVAALIAAAFSVIPGAQAPQPARPAAAPARPASTATLRTADGKANLNGIWQALNEANWDIEGHSAGPGRVLALGAEDAVVPGLGIVDGGPLPYLPAAAAKRKANFEKRLTLDPEIKCYLPGVPRAMYLPQPFQIIQSQKHIMMAFQYAGAIRTIYMDEHTDAPADSWMGWSNGHWEGDTLVIDTAGFNDSTWFDRAGNFHSDALHVVERITPAGADLLNYEATIDDKNVFSRPWKISMPIYRRKEKGARLLEFRCVEFVEDLIYGALRKPGTRTQQQ